MHIQYTTILHSDKVSDYNSFSIFNTERAIAPYVMAHLFCNGPWHCFVLEMCRETNKTWMPVMRILMVEDEKYMAEAIAKVLKKNQLKKKLDLKCT